MVPKCRDVFKRRLNGFGLCLDEHDFASSKTTDHFVVGDETENNSVNNQTPVVENQHINPPEEQELMAKADFDAPKKPVSVFDLKSLPKTTREKKNKEMLEQREK
ncbi:uncharacterized protein TNCV_3394481 [Trichonephila clavipes]|nr:uncharacterized protein TNCV_3394481 [Trichonephila clavipes]